MNKYRKLTGGYNQINLPNFDKNRYHGPDNYLYQGNDKLEHKILSVSGNTLIYNITMIDRIAIDISNGYNAVVHQIGTSRITGLLDHGVIDIKNYNYIPIYNSKNNTVIDYKPTFEELEESRLFLEVIINQRRLFLSKYKNTINVNNRLKHKL